MMTAMIASQYGSPAASLSLRTMPEPVIGDTDVLVRVRASLVTAADCAFLSADPAVVRLMYGLRRPKYPVLGVEFAGEVAAAGASVLRFSVGDRVFGVSPKRFGAHATLIAVGEASIERMPAELSFAESAALLEAATAHIFFTRVTQLKADDRVLVIGASGAVGTSAVQLAKHLGAHVTGVSSNVELVMSLGADAVIDYTSEAITGEYDVILDAVGGSSFAQARRWLSPRGVYLAAVPNPGVLAASLWTRLRGGQRAIFAATGLMHTDATLGELVELASVVRPVIDRRFALADLAAAYDYVGTGRKRGSVAVES